MPGGFSSGFSLGFGIGVRAYMFLEDHYIAPYYIQAGMIASTDPNGGFLPPNWVPTPNVDPLTTEAVQDFYAAGPRKQGLIRQQWSFIPVSPPVTRWTLYGPGFSPGFGPGFQTQPNLWVLTGLGSNITLYPPKFAIMGNL